MHWFFPMMDNIFFNLWNKDRVGRHEKSFYFIFNGNKKLQGRHKNIGSVGLAETQVFFFFGLIRCLCTVYWCTKVSQK